MDIYADIEQWRLDFINNPPPIAKSYTREEWENIVLKELIANPNIFSGDKNGHYNNPTNYKHSDIVKQKISNNHSHYWKDKEVPWKGRSRPDSVDWARQMGYNNKGRDPWNKGLEVGPLSEDHRASISESLKGKPKPKITCPHCKKEGGASAMHRWHFDNCKEAR